MTTLDDVTKTITTSSRRRLWHRRNGCVSPVNKGWRRMALTGSLASSRRRFSKRSFLPAECRSPAETTFHSVFVNQVPNTMPGIRRRMAEKPVVDKFRIRGLIQEMCAPVAERGRRPGGDFGFLLKVAIHVTAVMSGVLRSVPLMDAPVEGRDYPGSLPELRAWFRSDDDCVDYLDWLRWPDGLGLLRVWLTLGLHRLAVREDRNHAKEVHG